MGPIKTINRWIKPMSQFCGFFTISSSTWSVGMPVCEMSYSRLLSKHLYGRHGQERQEIAAAHHAEHVAEIRARAHFDVFDDIRENLASFHDAFFQHEQAPLEQDDVGRFLGDIHRGIHGNAHVGGLERRGVVDAVAQKAHGLALALEALDDAFPSAWETDGRTPRPRSPFCKAAPRKARQAGTR